MACGIITDYFAPIARPVQSQEATLLSAAPNEAYSNDDTSSSSQTATGTLPTLPSSQNDDGGQPNSNTQPPRKKLKITAANECEIALIMSQKEKKGVKRVKTEETINEPPR